MSNSYLFLRQMTSSLTNWTSIQSVEYGLNQNLNTVARFRMTAYDVNYNLLAYSPIVTLINPTDSYVVTNFSTPVVIPPATTFYIGLFTESAEYAGFGSTSCPSMLANFLAAPPAVFVSTSTNTQRPIQAWACPVANPTATPSSSTSAPRVASTSSSPSTAMATSAMATSTMAASAILTSTVVSSPTGTSSTAVVPPTNSPSSSTTSALTNGQWAGVIVGCVVGTNLLLICCLWLLCIRPASTKAAHTSKTTNSEQEPSVNQSRVEMVTREDA